MATQTVETQHAGRTEPAGATNAFDVDRRLQALTNQVRPAVQRARTLAELNEIYRAGSAPDPLPVGFQPGRLLTMSVSQPLDATVRRIADVWMPWQGKQFNPARMAGVNIMTRDARLPIRMLFGTRPVYRTRHLMQIFPFRNRIAPGAVDPDVQTLKIDYDFSANPGFIRRILDEVTQIDDGVYLGKILFRLRDRFHLIGYFSLRNPAP